MAELNNNQMDMLTDGSQSVDLIDRTEYRKKLNEYYEHTPKSHQKTVLDLIEILESMQSKLPRKIITHKERTING